jgi:hypothetical protein
MYRYTNIMMNFIKNKYSFITKNYNTPLGRWSVDKCDNKTLMTNYYNNIDHCGSCFYDKKELNTMIKKNTSHR